MPAGSAETFFTTISTAGLENLAGAKPPAQAAAKVALMLQTKTLSSHGLNLLAVCNEKLYFLICQKKRWQDLLPANAPDNSGYYPRAFPRALCPRKREFPPSSFSILSNSLYLATRSVRAGAPVLIIPALTATAIWAIVTSSVSPDR